MENAKIVTRPIKASDQDFIINSWLTGQYYGDWHFSQMPKELFFSQRKALIQRLLLDPATQIAVAVLEEDPDLIMAYQVTSNSTLHWAYTKLDYRGKGLQKLLIGNKQVKETSAITKPGAAIIKKKQWIFNPLR